MAILNLQQDVLTYKIFSYSNLDFESLQICRFVCRKLRDMIPFRKFEISKLGSLGLLKWSRNLGAPFDYYTCSNAVRNRNYEMMHWAYDRGAHLDKWVAATIALDGNLQELQWAIENGAGYGEKMSLICYSIHSKNLKLVQYIYLIEHDVMDESLLDSAIYYGALDIFQWLWETGAARPNPITDLCKTAIECGQLDILKHIRTLGIDWCPNACTIALENQYPNILEWLRSLGAP
jgi:hypothetical protein